MLKSSAAYIWYQRTLVKVSTGKTVWTQIRPDLDLHFLSKKASSSKAILLLWIIYVISVMFLLCFRAGLFIDALKSPAGKGLPSWLSFVMSNFEVVTFPLLYWVRCGAWLYRFLIVALFLTTKAFQQMTKTDDFCLW